MSTFLEDLRQQRQKYLDGLDANRNDIDLEVFDDFYPDKAHFLFELLQNAEDAGATEAEFKLRQTDCYFIHNGTRPFSEEDVRSITGIHNSTKKDAAGKIGKFGVGFKSVFVYTDSPHVYSDLFTFKILRRVLPEEVDFRDDFRGRTAFWIPFNKSKKSSEAYSEVRAGLSDLADTTLLFLTNLSAIRWEVEGESSGEVRRIQHAEHHFEIRLLSSGVAPSCSHFLRFDRSVPGLESQRVAVAFQLGPHSEGGLFNGEKPLADQFRIEPARPGQVAVYFPAKKERSNLRFHVHAPFVPELSRASIKETPTNKPLFEQLARLTADSLHRIRDLGLLTTEFLGVLPKRQDEVGQAYQIIRELIVAAMDSEPLTPVDSGGHAPAKELLKAKASLKALLTEEDLKVLRKGENRSRWVRAASQKNGESDRFLEQLAIEEWDIKEFGSCLTDGTSIKQRHSFDLNTGAFQKTWGLDPDVMSWLSGKPTSSLQRIYAILSDESSKPALKHKFAQSKIVRSTTGDFCLASKIFFESDPDPTHSDDGLHMVDAGVYTAPDNKTKQPEDARKFLEAIGVVPIGEAERVKHLLDKTYVLSENHKQSRQDLTRLIRAWENGLLPATLGRFRILQSSDGTWHTPDDFYIDAPFKDTGLSEYHRLVGEKSKYFALADWYRESEVPCDKFERFARAVGVQTHLLPKCVDCSNNPEKAHLYSVGGERYGNWIDKDYRFEGLNEVLETPNVALSKLIWRSLIVLPTSPNYLEATYQKNDRWGPRTRDSQLVHQLRNAAWVPQGDGRFVRPAEADRSLLPEGFEFDSGWPWLKKIRFGQDVDHRREQIKNLGFESVETLEWAQQVIALLPPEERQQMLDELKRRADVTLPTHDSSNPERRYERVREEAQEAPEREFENRLRSVATGCKSIDKQADEYLREQYTNNDGVMICQLCQSSMPFQLENDTYYFEKACFLPDLSKTHYQNHLALCPNHWAMFKYANGPRNDLISLFAAMNGDLLDLELARTNQRIYFTKTHAADLRAVLEAEGEIPPTHDLSGDGLRA